MGDSPLKSSSIIYHENQGQLHVRMGPMFAGKTTWLNGELTKMADTGWKVLRVSYAQDKRETTAVDELNGVTSHNSQFVRLSKLINNISVNSIDEVDPGEYHVIGVDEAQFYDEKLVSIVTHWVRELGCIVYVTALDADSDGNLFGHTAKLMPISTTYEKMTSFCHYCRAEGKLTTAVITACLRDRDDVKLVGGAETYVPTCLRHHQQYNVPTQN